MELAWDRCVNIYATCQSEDARHTLRRKRERELFVGTRAAIHTRQLEHGNTHIPGRPYTCSAPAKSLSLSLGLHFPTVYSTSQQDERGDANNGNKLSLVTNNGEERGARAQETQREGNKITCPDNYYLSSSRSEHLERQLKPGRHFQEPPGPGTSGGSEGQSERERGKRASNKNRMREKISHKLFISMQCLWRL